MTYIETAIDFPRVGMTRDVKGPNAGSHCLASTGVREDSRDSCARVRWYPTPQTQNLLAFSADPGAAFDF
jgi:hypothetical protein